MHSSLWNTLRRVCEANQYLKKDIEDCSRKAGIPQSAWVEKALTEFYIHNLYGNKHYPQNLPRPATIQEDIMLASACLGMSQVGVMNDAICDAVTRAAMDEDKPKTE